MIRYSAIPIVFSLSVIAIIIIMIATAYASTISFDHILKDSIALIARIELAVESFLHYARDYASIAVVSFLIKEIEEAIVSKYKEDSTYIIARADIQVVEDKHYSNKNELITIGSKATIIAIEEDNNNKEREEGG